MYLNDKHSWSTWAAATVLLTAPLSQTQVLFDDDFNRGIPGWSAIQPEDTYLDGPMRWQYDIVSGSFLEQSNIYTGPAGGSTTAKAVMLINEAVTGETFEYSARLVAGDDDAFGLIFGFQDENNFYRVTFPRQSRDGAAYPYNEWNVDRFKDGVPENLFGFSMPNHFTTFINTNAQAFDVIIEVTTGNNLTLKVQDDAENFPIEYILVDNQPLPEAAAGQVGMFTWGMSGNAPRGFQIKNLALSPEALVGNPNALSDWEVVSLARADGETALIGGNAGVGIWSLALGVDGSYGTLHENSDAYNTATDINGNSNIDFISPTVVAGDTAWVDYQASFRILPQDDDGHGALVRFVDANNFVRIAFAQQGTGVGRPWQGLSVQQCVNGVWSEVFHEDSPTFVPTSGVAFDLFATLIGSQLQLQIVNDPDNTGEVHSFGPFQIDPSLSQGKIGLFSWGMARTEFDSVSVLEIDGLPLQVNSAFGNPTPAIGLNSYDFGDAVEATVESVVEDLPGVRRVLTGWTGEGSVPVSGTENTVSFVINTPSALTWNWETQYQVNVTASSGGQVNVDGSTGEYLPEGSDLTITATADNGYLFAGWSGATGVNEPSLSWTLTRPLTLTANFLEDSDADGLPDNWEREFFGDLSQDAGSNPDGDAWTNIEEWEMGTNPDFAEQLLAEADWTNRWVNVQRDPALPGQFGVVDFGDGYRGAYDVSNDFRGADDGSFIGTENLVDNVSFDGPRIIVREEFWDESWNDFTAEITFTVGDNDGNCFYFRYVDENNWYRLTIVGENNSAAWRAPFGISVQKRVHGIFSEIISDQGIATDPADTSFYKKVKATVSANGDSFEVKVIGWDTFQSPAMYNPASEITLPFFDTDHAAGRIGYGSWGQGGGSTATATIPVPGGVLVDDITVNVGGTVVFEETFEDAPLQNELPDGWENPFVGNSSLDGDWRVSAHGTIVQISNDFAGSTGTLETPKADVEGPILLAPDFGSTAYLLNVGIHAFDDDGVGIVYDYENPDNFARVFLASQGSGNGRLPQGVNISRKVDGVWTDFIVEDTGFVYTPGAPFHIQLANENGSYTLTIMSTDEPEMKAVWRWSDSDGVNGGRVGFTCWGEADAHFTSYSVSSMPTIDQPGALEITSITIAGGQVVLGVSNEGGATYNVEFSSDLSDGSWQVVESGLTADTWTGSADSGQGFWRLSR